MLWSLLTVSVTLSVLLADTSLTAAGPIVTTQYGQLEGSRRIHKGQLYEEYLGIPFAAPPVGDLRWQKPQPAAPWEGILNATEFSLHCVQQIDVLYPYAGIGGDSDEDCLYLNVWVPRGVAANEGNLLPVMFWVYGGGFQMGTGEMYPGYGLALHGDVVVVNFNYRLNAMGFFSTEDSSAPGNYGLWDQHAALTWVKQNIDAFAGDANRITIFGQSAGSRSVSHLMVSPYTTNLIQNAICISGSSLGNTALIGRPGEALRTAILLGKVFNCSANTTSQIVACLRQQTAEDLNIWGMLAPVLLEDREQNFYPVIDGDFVPQAPMESHRQGVGKHINFITGLTYQDAAGFVINNPIALPFLGDRLNEAETNESMWEELRMEFGFSENGDELINAIIDRYPDMDTTDNFTRTLAMTEMKTDYSYGAGGNWEANRHAEANGTGRTYQYVFQHRQSFLVGYPEWINGSHMDDIYSVLGEPFFDVYRRIYCRADFDELDLRISSDIMNYYSNLAYTGDPNQGPFPVTVEWRQFDPARQNYLLQAPYFSMQEFDQERLDKYRFWIEEFPPLVKWPPPPTMPENVESTWVQFIETDMQFALEQLKETIGNAASDVDTIQQHIEDFINVFKERRGIRFYQ